MLKPTYTTSQIADYLNNGYWNYAGAQPHHFTTHTITFNIDALNAAEQQLALFALSAWQNVANLTFVRTSGSALISFDNTQPGAFTQTYYADAATIWAYINVSTSWVNNYGTAIGTYSLQTYIHEIGHALGLGHAGSYNGSANYNANVGYGQNSYLNDTWQFTVMSYFAQSDWASSGSSFRFVSTPMIADIAAITALYGASTQTSSGNTVYGFNSNAGLLYDFGWYRQLGQRAPALTIVGHGGTNTLDVSGYSTNDIIDLTPGAASSIGGLINNITIDSGTLIHDAIAGSGNDLLIGNSADNELIGGAGNDTLIGGGGADTLTGGSGINTFVMRAGSGNDVITDFSAGSAYGHDIVQLDGYHIGNFGAVQANLSQVGSNAVLALGHAETLTFWNVDVAAFTAADFMFLNVANRSPVIAVAPLAASSKRQVLAASTLFTASDPDTGDTIKKVQFWDDTPDPRGGHFVVNGQAQGALQTIEVTADQLAQTTFQSGATTDHLYVRAFDGTDWSGWRDFFLTGFFNHAPQVAVGPLAASSRGQIFAASTLFSVSDGDPGDTIQKVQFWDDTADPRGGRFVVNGQAQGALQTIEVASAQLAQTTFQSGSITDHLYVRAFDGTDWGGWRDFFLTGLPNHAPQVAVGPLAASSKGQVYAASALFNVSDADVGDTIQKLQFWDDVADPRSGHFVVNGQAQGALQTIEVTAAQLAQTTFQSGATTDHLYVRVFDGADWGGWRDFFLTGLPNHAPQVAVGPLAASSRGQVFAASALFSASDADPGDTIQKVQFWDDTADPRGGHFVVSGQTQGSEQTIEVTSAHLAQTTFQSGSIADHLYVRTFDGTDWGGWRDFFLTGVANHAPIVSLPSLNQSVGHDTGVAASSLFSATDADADTITRYQLWDDTADPHGGHFVVNGQVQAAQQAIEVTSGQLAQTEFHTGAVTDHLYVRAFDGIDWGPWRDFFIS